MLDTISQNLADPAYQVVLIAITVAGVVRGFAGFGTGMIISPVAAAMFSPKIALIIIIVVDSWPAVPPALQSRQYVSWRELIPVLVGYAFAVPAGLAFVIFGDVITLRWFISITIFILVAVLWSGWQYTGPRSIPISFGVGNVCGFLGASSALPGPPAIIYWMASSAPARVVRANMLMFLLLTEFLTGTGYLVSGLFTLDAAIKGLIATPLYFLGIQLGSRYFHGSSELLFRRVAFTLILLAAVTSLPLFDPFWS